MNLFTQAKNKVGDFLDKIHPMSKMAYKVLSNIGGKVLTGVTKVGLGMISTMVFIQQTGSDARNEFIDEKDWHTIMDTITLTRPGYQQNRPNTEIIKR